VRRPATATRSPQTPTALLRPRSLRGTGGLGAELWTSGTYDFDPAGNITGMGASRFTCDGLSRLTSAKTCPDGYDSPPVFRDGFESGDTTVWGQPFLSGAGSLALGLGRVARPGGGLEAAGCRGSAACPRMTQWKSRRATGAGWP
jgi:hypothetical protein